MVSNYESGFRQHVVQHRSELDDDVSRNAKLVSESFANILTPPTLHESNRSPNKMPAISNYLSKYDDRSDLVSFEPPC